MKGRLFATLVIGTLVACHRQPLAPSSAGGLTLSLTVSRTDVLRGEPDTITMTLTNTNDHAVSLSGDACEPRPYVADARGVTVVPSGGDWICIMVLQRLELAAGERLLRTFVWGTDSFAPGVYAVHATFTAQEAQLATPPLAVRLN